MSRRFFLALLGWLGLRKETDAANKKHLPSEVSESQFIIETSLGMITIELDLKNAPISSANFQSYVDGKFYDGLIFHRVIPDFMIQGGGMDADMNEKRGRAPIKNEAKNGLKNRVGTLAMARTQDPDSATSQFFINVKDNSFLDRTESNAGYAVFGKVVAGMDVVLKIAGVERGQKGGHNDVPATPVIIKSVRRASK